MIDTRGWPPLLAQIADVTSPATALKLVMAFGGVSCVFPKEPAEGHAVVDVIGLDAARALAPHLSGRSIEIPVLASRRQLKRAIVRAEGRTSDIARDLGCTSRYVRMIRNAGSSVDPRQTDMFGES